MDNAMQEKIGQIQMIQQNMENFSAQRQQFQIQQTEIETAIAELTTTNQSYKIIGNIMVLANKDQLKKDLEEKKEMLNIRINSIEKQEEKLRAKVEELQKDVLSNLEDKNDKNKKQKATK